MKTFRKIATYAVPVIFVLLLAGLILSRVWQPEVSPEPEITIQAGEAEFHIGTSARVCGRVYEATFADHIGGEPVFLNFSRAYPEQDFTAVIWSRNFDRWSQRPDFIYSSNSTICVSGRIEMHRGIPQIVVDFPDQIEFE